MVEERYKFTVAVNREYKETDSINFHIVHIVFAFLLNIPKYVITWNYIVLCIAYKANAYLVITRFYIDTGVTTIIQDSRQIYVFNFFIGLQA